MKKKREHRVPLTLCAQSLLLKLERLDHCEFVFPGQNGQGHLSNGAMLTLLARMGFPHITTHGFRSTFKDWATEKTAFPFEVSEMALVAEK